MSGKIDPRYTHFRATLSNGKRIAAADTVKSSDKNADDEEDFQFDASSEQGNANDFQFDEAMPNQFDQINEIADNVDCGNYDEDGQSIAAASEEEENRDDSSSDESDMDEDPYNFDDRKILEPVKGITPIPEEFERLNRVAGRNELIDEFLEMDLNHQRLQEQHNNNDLFDAAGGTPHLAHEFNRDISNWVNLETISRSAQVGLVTILEKYFPNADFSNLKQAAQSKKASDVRTCVIDVCPDGCTSFILDRKKLIRCPLCGANRFTPCDARVNGGVGGKCSDEDCTPFERVEGKYFHSSGRKSVRTAKYRPIIPLFKELVRLNIMEGKKYLYNDTATTTAAIPAELIEDFEVEVKDINDTVPPPISFVHDINSSRNADIHKRDMKFNFERAQSCDENKDIELINVCFLISVFYDGGTLFKRKSLSVWPLVMSILNTSPNIRVKPGLGMFLVALHDLSVGTGAEQSLFTELFVPELNELGNGIKYTMIDNTGKTVHAFIQVRLLCHVLDTKALMSSFFVEGVNSLCCCAQCNCMEAMSRKQTTDRISYRTARNTLRQDHPLRFCGHSKQCCPKGYYSGSQNTVDAVTQLFKNYSQNEVSVHPTYGSSLITRNKSGAPNLNHFSKAASLSTASCEDNVIHTKFPATFNLTLENKNYKWTNFSAMVSHAHCDYREKVIYKRWDDYEFRSKVYAWWECYYTNIFQAERTARQLPPLTHKQMLKKLEVPMKFITTNRVRGINGLNPFNYLLSSGYYGFAKYCMFDPFHSFMNFAIAVISLAKGTSGRQTKCIKLCLCENRFPFIKLRTVAETEDAKKAAASNTKKSISKKSILSNSSSNSNNNNSNSSSSNSSIINNNNNIDNGISSSIYTGMVSVGNGNVPYYLPPSQQEMVDWMHASIIIPKGMKSSHSFRKIFAATSHLKGNDKIKFVTTFIKFDLAFTTLPNDFKNLLAMFSDLLSDILSPAVNDAEIADLLCRTFEALCFWDSMLPDSEQYYCIHELIDIVHGLSMFGPVRGWWALAGERFMAKIKRFCPSGGTRCVDVIYKKFIAYEDSIRQRYDSTTADDVDLYQNVDGDLKNWKIRFLGMSYQFIWNTYVSDSFYRYLSGFVNVWEVNHMELYSSFYRVYKTYMNSVLKVHKDRSFTIWINNIVEKQLIPISNGKRGSPIVCIDYDNIKVLKKCKLVMCDLTVMGYDLSDLDYVVELTHTNTLMESDLPTVLQIYQFTPLCYNVADIGGLKFRGRGSKAAEMEPPSLYGTYKNIEDKLRVTHNPLNNLKKMWPYNVSQLSKVRLWRNTSNKKDGAMSNHTSYVHNNCFFTLKLENDSFLNGTKFASVTARHTLKHEVTDAIHLTYIKLNTTDVKTIELSDAKHQIGLNAKTGSKNIDEHNDHVNERLAGEMRISKRKTVAVGTVSVTTAAADIFSSYDEDVQFVSLNFYEPTNVAACGVTAARRPVLVKSLSKGYSHAELLQAEKMCSFDIEEAEDLFLIDLHNNRGDVKVSLRNSKL